MFNEYWISLNLQPTCNIVILQYIFFSIETHFIITNHIFLVRVQTNYCNKNLLILDVKQLNKIMKLYDLKALWDGQDNIKMYYGMSRVEKQLSGKRSIGSDSCNSWSHSKLFWTFQPPTFTSLVFSSQIQKFQDSTVRTQICINQSICLWIHLWTVLYFSIFLHLYTVVSLRQAAIFMDNLYRLLIMLPFCCHVIIYMPW